MLGWVLKRRLTAHLKKAVKPSYKINVRFQCNSDPKHVEMSCGKCLSAAFEKRQDCFKVISSNVRTGVVNEDVLL